ncbi:MAG: S-layer homology domain-containing protein [Oscillospiraceae bacterium]|nr:S-layer homology domain-containing protein [Oscillospiraceae bacterium]
MNKKTNTLRRLLALILTFALACSLAAPALADEEDTYEYTPQPVTEENRTAWRDLDPDEAVADMQSMLDAMVAAAEDESVSDEDVIEAYIEVLEQIYALKTNSYIAQWDYYRDFETYGDSYAALYDAFNSVSVAYTEAVQAMLEARHEFFEEYWGEETVEEALNASAYTDEQLALLSEETELINEYYAAMAEDVVDYEAVGEIYLELLRVRNAFAESLGYENYAEYAYPNVYYRDYTPEQAAALCAEVGEYIMPVFRTLYFAENEPFAGLDTDYVTRSRTEAELVEAVQPYLGKISSELTDIFDYMLNNNLLDAEDLETKQSGAHTQSLPYYNSAYIYIGEGCLDPYILVHEFGHFSRYCITDYVECYDVSEIHSQGLEALYTTFADDLAGEGEEAAAYVYYELRCLLGNVEFGAANAMFELAAYTADLDTLTVEDLSAIFTDIAMQFGYVTDASYWFSVPHFFDSPCYYISYMTSAMNALELLVMADEDFDTAAATYMNLLTQPDTYGYSAAVTAVGLTDMFSDGAVETLAAELTEYIAEFESDYLASKSSTFADVTSGSCYADAVMWAVENGITAGTSGTEFSPDDACTRAQAATFLWRAAGSPEASGENPFNDVSESDYCYTAVLWALENGITTGTSGTEFNPDADCTRAEIVTFLYRVYKGTAEAAGGFADVAANAWYAPAVAWAVDNEITNGTGEGAFSPNDGCTRGQIVTFLYRAEN